MSSSAQRDLYNEMYEQPAVLNGTDGAAALRHIAAERLAAHRSRRATLEPQAVEMAATAPRISAAAQRVRDAVAARYEATPTFREFLETQPAVGEPQPAAVAASPWVEEAVQVAEPVGALEAASEPAAVALEEEAWDWQTASAPAFDGELEVKPYRELPQPNPLPERSYVQPAAHAEEIEGLEEEIEFRLAPEFVEHHIEPLPIQANIIEFPRQLVAAKKARPRLAEGPLRADEPTAAVATAVATEPVAEFQMRIFEVEPDVFVAEPTQSMAATAEPVLAEAKVPEWQELVLQTPKKAHADRGARTASATDDVFENIPVAPLELRLMSAVVDGVCVGGSAVVFVSVAVWMSGHSAENALRELSLPVLAALAIAGVGVLGLLYQAVFFTLGATTLGMSYAGLVFRTLAGKQPTRSALRKRVGANVLAVMPLGLGIMWGLFDGQKLGWNDRMSGVFLREF